MVRETKRYCRMTKVEGGFEQVCDSDDVGSSSSSSSPSSVGSANDGSSIRGIAVGGGEEAVDGKDEAAAAAAAAAKSHQLSLLPRIVVTHGEPCALRPRSSFPSAFKVVARTMTEGRLTPKLAACITKGSYDEVWVPTPWHVQEFLKREVGQALPEAAPGALDFYAGVEAAVAAGGIGSGGDGGSSGSDTDSSLPPSASSDDSSSPSSSSTRPHPPPIAAKVSPIAVEVAPQQQQQQQQQQEQQQPWLVAVAETVDGKFLDPLKVHDMTSQEAASLLHPKILWNHSAFSSSLFLSSSPTTSSSSSPATSSGDGNRTGAAVVPPTPLSSSSDCGVLQGDSNRKRFVVVSVFKWGHRKGWDVLLEVVHVIYTIHTCWLVG
jgi:hypothetical protein